MLILLPFFQNNKSILVLLKPHPPWRQKSSLILEEETYNKLLFHRHACACSHTCSEVSRQEDECCRTDLRTQRQQHSQPKPSTPAVTLTQPLGGHNPPVTLLYRSHIAKRTPLCCWVLWEFFFKSMQILQSPNAFTKNILTRAYSPTWTNVLVDRHVATQHTFLYIHTHTRIPEGYVFSYGESAERVAHTST